MHLGYLPGYGASAVRAEYFGKLLERPDQTVRRFVKNHGPRLSGKFLQPGAAAFLHRQEALKAESVTRIPGTDKRRDESGRPRKCLDINPFLNTCPHQQKAGIGYARSTGIAYQRHIQPAEDAVLNDRHGLVLVELVMRLQPAVYVIVLQQHRACPCVLGQYQVGILQDSHRPESHVLEIPDRGRDNIKLPRSRFLPLPVCHFSFLLSSIMNLYTRSESISHSGNSRERYSTA